MGFARITRSANGNNQPTIQKVLLVRLFVKWWQVASCRLLDSIRVCSSLSPRHPQWRRCSQASGKCIPLNLTLKDLATGTALAVSKTNGNRRVFVVAISPPSLRNLSAYWFGVIRPPWGNVLSHVFFFFGKGGIRDNVYCSRKGQMTLPKSHVIAIY